MMYGDKMLESWRRSVLILLHKDKGVMQKNAQIIGAWRCWRFWKVFLNEEFEAYYHQWHPDGIHAWKKHSWCPIYCETVGTEIWNIRKDLFV